MKKILIIIVILVCTSCRDNKEKTTCEILWDQRSDIDLRDFGDQKALIESNERLLIEANCLR